MAKASGTDLKGFNAQLATTYMYWTPAAAVAAVTSPRLVTTMDSVRKFSFEKGLLGAGAKTVDAVGIEFPGGKTLGNPKSITMRFDPSIHEAGGGRQALATRRRCAADQPARRREANASRSARCRFMRAAGRLRVRLAAAAGRECERQAAAIAGEHGAYIPRVCIHRRCTQRPIPVLGRTPGPA